MSRQRSMEKILASEYVSIGELVRITGCRYSTLNFTGITEQADHAHGCPGDALRYDIDSHEAPCSRPGAHREA